RGRRRRPTCPPKLKAKEGLTFAKFGSNFFVNLDQERKRVRRVGGAPCAAARTERQEALFIFCRELPEKRRKGNAKI
ncbi:hypothetical protein COS51_03330, partial [Candidatus Roizmanbacteria bacterium CG03_land_8_20_14_0_80_36_21]